VLIGHESQRPPSAWGSSVQDDGARLRDGDGASRKRAVGRIKLRRAELRIVGDDIHARRAAHTATRAVSTPRDCVQVTAAP
jgi:hypothetical protein